MTVVFFDLQESSNPMNALRITNKIELDEALEKLGNREPFSFELVGENGYKLLVGFGKAIGCVQHSRTDGDTPYLMAVAPGAWEAKDYFEFLAGDTPTPISKRYCMPWEQVRQIANYFLETGDRSPDISWEEI
jgi:hypothetical protein